MRIGFIGLGIMGKPMCLNLLKAGFSVTVWNRTKSKTNDLVKNGASLAISPRQVAEKSEIIITIVKDSADVEEVILGRDGVFEGGKAGDIVIDMSTISPFITQRIAAKLLEKGIEMLDAPVSGGDSGAIAGTLSIMVGGKAETLARCLSVFNVLGKTITHVGSIGMGQSVKLCNQILVSVTNMAVCEAVTFCQASGIDPQIMIQATQNGAAGSWQLINLGPKMVRRDFYPGFMIDLQQKDLRLATESAQALNLKLPALSLVKELFANCVENGEGKEGSQALIKALERINGSSTLSSKKFSLTF
ncbi:MAG: NAD(P)-dependent oxidoreductase [Calditrichaeota bacterium]|nr:MAG: NAD(P)-dependent oxidoreductase [Calditrichota bacterium]